MKKKVLLFVAVLCSVVAFAQTPAKDKRAAHKAEIAARKEAMKAKAADHKADIAARKEAMKAKIAVRKADIKAKPRTNVVRPKIRTKVKTRP
jgi:hypothetical protein